MIPQTGDWFDILKKVMKMYQSSMGGFSKTTPEQGQADDFYIFITDEEENRWSQVRT
jgi:hypothetical protein